MGYIKEHDLLTPELQRCLNDLTEYITQAEITAQQGRSQTSSLLKLQKSSLRRSVYYKLFKKQSSSRPMRPLPKYKLRAETEAQEVSIANVFDEVNSALANEDTLHQQTAVDSHPTGRLRDGGRATPQQCGEVPANT